jgi:hypothetical protein
MPGRAACVPGIKGNGFRRRGRVNVLLLIGRPAHFSPQVYHNGQCDISGEYLFSNVPVDCQASGMLPSKVLGSLTPQNSTK